MEICHDKWNCSYDMTKVIFIVNIKCVIFGIFLHIFYMDKCAVSAG